MKIKIDRISNVLVAVSIPFGILFLLHLFFGRNSVAETSFLISSILLSGGLIINYLEHGELRFWNKKA